MFYQTYKTAGHTQRNHTPVSHLQMTVKANNSHPHVPSGTGAPSKESELHCYKCGQKGYIKPQCPKLKGKQCIAKAQIENFTKEDKELSDTPMNRTPMDALDESTFPQEGEDNLKNNSGDKEEDQEYKANLIHFINEEPTIDATI